MASPPCPSADDEATALALEQCGRDFDAVIERMLKLNLDGGDDNNGDDSADPDSSSDHHQQLATATPQPLAAAAGGAGAEDGAYWVETMLTEMSSAVSTDDARERGLRVLDAFGTAVDASSRAGAAARLDAASTQNAILRRAVLFHHRLRVAQVAAREKLQLQVDDYREQVRRLEAANYALTLHLRQADLHRGGGGAMPSGPGNPEIF